MVWKIVGVALYLGVLVLLGVLASRRMKDLRDYFAGGKKLGFLAVAFSARATGESAWLLLGLTGMGAAVGVKAFWVVLGETLGVAGAWIFMSLRFKRLTDRYDAITIPDYFDGRFPGQGHALRVAAAGCLVVFITIYVSAQIDATGAAFESFLGWNYYAGALTGFAVVCVYIVTGGFLAVVWSDVFQGTLMVLGLVALPIAGLVAAGGPSAVADTLRGMDPALLHPFGSEGYSLLGLCGVLGLSLIGLGFLGSPQIFVRFLALKDEAEIGRGTLTAVVWTLLADGGAVLVGLTGRALLGGTEVGADLGSGGQDVLPLLVHAVMPAFLVGLYIAIVLSAIMSTVDSLLVLASSAVVRDGYQKVLRPDLPDDALVRQSRATTLVLAACGLAIALSVAALVPGRTVFWFVIFGWSGIAATFCPVTILSLFWPGLTRNGALAGMLAGFVSVPYFKFAGSELGPLAPYLDALSELPPAFVVSGLVAVLVSKGDRRAAIARRTAEEDLAFAREGPGPDPGSSS